MVSFIYNFINSHCLLYDIGTVAGAVGYLATFSTTKINFLIDENITAVSCEVQDIVLSFLLTNKPTIRKRKHIFRTRVSFEK